MATLTEGTPAGNAGPRKVRARTGRKSASEAVPHPHPVLTPRLVGTTVGDGVVTVVVDYPLGTRNDITGIPAEAHRVAYCELLLAIRNVRKLQQRDPDDDEEPTLDLLFYRRRENGTVVWETRPNGRGETGVSHAEMLRLCVDGFRG